VRSSHCADGARRLASCSCSCSCSDSTNELGKDNEGKRGKGVGTARPHPRVGGRNRGRRRAPRAYFPFVVLPQFVGPLFREQRGPPGLASPSWAQALWSLRLSHHRVTRGCSAPRITRIGADRTGGPRHPRASAFRDPRCDGIARGKAFDPKVQDCLLAPTPTQRQILPTPRNVCPQTAIIHTGACVKSVQCHVLHERAAGCTLLPDWPSPNAVGVARCADPAPPN